MMKVFVSIIAYGFTALVTVYGFLLSQYNAEWLKKSELRELIVPLPFGFYLLIAFVIVSVMFHVLLHNYPAMPLLAEVKEPQGVVLTKSTERAFDLEFEGAALEAMAAAKEYFMAGERDFATAAYEDAAKNYEKSISKLETMSAYLNLSVSRHLLASFDKAEQASKKGLAIARRKEHPIFIGAFLVHLSLINNKQGNFGSALKYIQEATNLFENEQDKRNWASALSVMGSIYLNQGLLEDALSYLNKSLKIHQDLTDFKNIGADYLIIGNIYIAQNKPKEALKAYQEALENYQKKGDLAEEATALGNIGGIYQTDGNFDKALEYQQQALQLFKRMHYPLGEANTIGNIGHIYRLQERMEDAIKCHTEALEIQERIGAKHDQAIQHNNLGIDYQELGNDEKTLFHYKQSLALSKKSGAEGYAVTVMINLGGFYFERCDYNNALQILLEALNTARKLNNINDERIILNNLAVIYSQTGNKAELVEVEKRLAAMSAAKR